MAEMPRQPPPRPCFAPSAAPPAVPPVVARGPELNQNYSAAVTGGTNSGGNNRQRNLRKKLFRLKNLGELQDTEENNDDSQFKVRMVHTDWLKLDALLSRDLIGLIKRKIKFCKREMKSAFVIFSTLLL